MNTIKDKDVEMNSWEHYGPYTNFAWWIYHLLIKRSIARHISGNSVLDFGCGNGELRIFVPSGKTYIGYDVHGKTDVKHWSERKYDTVVANASFEHTPKDELERFIKHCKDTGVGKIICVVPGYIPKWLDNFSHFMICVVFGRQVSLKIREEHITLPEEVEEIVNRYYRKIYQKPIGSMLNQLIIWIIN